MSRDVDLMARAYRRALSPGSDACPPLETLAASALGETGASALGGGAPPPAPPGAPGVGSADLAAADREPLADHVVSCRRCADAYRLLLDTHREAAGAGVPGASRATKASWSSRPVPALALAAGLAALGVGLTVTWRVLGPHLQTEGERGEAPGRGDDGLLPPRDAELAAAPERLAWQGSAAGGEPATYRVTLFDASGNVLWRSEPRHEPAASVPGSVRAALRRGQSFFWVVDVEGETASRLGPYPFRIRP